MNPAGGGDALAVAKNGAEGPVPAAWRPALTALVDALAREEDVSAGLSAGPLHVAPLSGDTLEGIRSYIEDYGATLVPLPPRAWDSSVSIWTGAYWDVMVDLWTADEGRSDMVLALHVHEREQKQEQEQEQERGYLAEVHMVYVP